MERDVILIVVTATVTAAFIAVVYLVAAVRSLVIELEKTNARRRTR